MKTLYIIRHAKSSWSDISLDDFERPLNKRGKNDAPVMGARLKQKNIMPDIIFSSSAKRAKMTAKIIANEIDYKKKIIFKKRIYEADINALHNMLKNIDDKYNIAFLIGHNPELNELAEFYVDYDDNLPTCAIIGIEFLCEHWKNVKPQNANLILFDYPKKSH